MGPEFDTWQQVVWNVLAAALALIAVIDIIRLLRRREGNRSRQIVVLILMFVLSINWSGYVIPIVPVIWLLYRAFGRTPARDEAPAETRAPREPDGTEAV